MESLHGFVFELSFIRFSVRFSKSLNLLSFLVSELWFIKFLSDIHDIAQKLPICRCPSTRMPVGLHTTRVANDPC